MRGHRAAVQVGHAGPPRGQAAPRQRGPGRGPGRPALAGHLLGYHHRCSTGYTSAVNRRLAARPRPWGRAARGDVRSAGMVPAIAIRAGELPAVAAIAGLVLAAVATAGVWWLRRRVRRGLRVLGLIVAGRVGRGGARPGRRGAPGVWAPPPARPRLGGGGAGRAGAWFGRWARPVAGAFAGDVAREVVALSAGMASAAASSEPEGWPGRRREPGR